MNNSKLFLQAHKMVRLTHQNNITYRKQFGQWLKYLKSGINNLINPNINRGCAMIPLLEHDRVNYVYSYDDSKFMTDLLTMLKVICTSKYSLFMMLAFIIYRLV